MALIAECRRKVLLDEFCVEFVVALASSSEVAAGSVSCPLCLNIQGNLNLVRESGAVAAVE